MRTLTRVACGAGALLAVLMPALAVASDKGKDAAATVGVSVDASALLGVGLSVGTGVGDRFNVRGVYHGYTYDDEFEDSGSGATYDGEIDLKSFGVLGDWHPFKGAFRITAGLMSNGNQINLRGVADANSRYEVGDCTFESDPNDPLRVDGVVDFKSTAPYLGLGWGGNMNAEPGFYGTFDIGVMFSGSPDTSLSGRGSARNANAAQAATCGDPVAYQDVSSYPQFRQEVQNAEDDVNEETKDFEYWPNIALGIGWRF